MSRTATTVLFVILAAIPAMSSFAQTAPEAGHHARKPVRPSKVTIEKRPALPGGLNAPSTDFSKIEPAGQESGGRGEGGSMRPVLTNGGRPGMGVGF